MAFSFGFSGDDIDASADPLPAPAPALPAAAASAFPIQGKPLLPPTEHPISSLLARLPSKIAFSALPVILDDGTTTIQLPRRELWDVRVQLMAEEDDPDAGTANDDGSGLGTHDVKTGVYEGGFKSWESSVDLVKVLGAQGALSAADQGALCVIELGCGTALPSLALFHAVSSSSSSPKTFLLADYNPTVLQHVTLPNLLLTWAVSHAPSTSFIEDDELEITPELISAFETFLTTTNTTLRFVSGAWSPEFDALLASLAPSPPCNTLLVAAETIYSPFALQAFTSTLFSVLRHEKSQGAVSLIGAKKMYFGVGGSLDDFVDAARHNGGNVEYVREEADGVRRGVVKCTLPQ